MAQDRLLDRFRRNLLSGQIDDLRPSAFEENVAIAQLHPVARVEPAAAQRAVSLRPISFSRRRAPNDQTALDILLQFHIGHRRADLLVALARRIGGVVTNAAALAGTVEIVNL